MSNNPHVNSVHIPAHVFGILGLAIAILLQSIWALYGFLLANLWFSCLGVSIGFHRYFTHKAFKANKFWHAVMLFGGTLAGQGSVVFWVALHRLHHANSDKHLDIHSPTKGFWNAYMGWIFNLNPADVQLNRAIDMIHDPLCKWTHRHYKNILWSWWALLIGVAIVFPITLPFISGMLIAGMWSIHQEALINSMCHDERFGEAPNVTHDLSRNINWLQWFTWGQALHNNHHKRPKDANFGQGRSDLGHHVIRLIQESS